MPLIDFIEMKNQIGSPAHARVSAFQDYFNSSACEHVPNGKEYFFISMPPFRRFNVFLKFRARIILDLRDGWSIAQASGYGGTIRKKPIKAWISRKIEWFLIRRSFITITCTPGLQKYLEKVSGLRVILIPNGISDQRLSLIKKLKKEHSIGQDNGKIIFVCAGKFSEYGVDKVKKLISVIATRYSGRSTEIRLLGADPEKNQWLRDYYKKLTKGGGSVHLLPRMGEEDLYKNMMEADYGLTIIRDPDYDFGTKIYDYIALGLPVVNYFERPNNFTDYFDACLDVGFGRRLEIPEIRRSALIEQGLKEIEFD